MQDFLAALLIGLILGWVIEWLIDWQYWRPTVTALRSENERLRRQLQAQGEAASNDPSAASVEKSRQTAAAKSKGE